jgi:acyl-CoA synthetase (AMP-forming)/AMP-acid ligase II
MTWSEARERMKRLANVLAALDVDIGEWVAVLAEISIKYVPLYYAASTAGVVPVPLNYRSAPPE